MLGDNGEPFEIQIRTYEMHRVAEYGIAAHWKYKEGKSGKDSNSEEMKLAWLRQTLEWQQEVNDPREFLDNLKMDLFSTQVFVFTPKGEVIDLPSGSTPLDFAFKIHTDVGCHCVGAKVNGKMVTIDHALQNGDIVEIVTSSNSSGPSVDWLKIARSSSARNKIRQWLKRENKGDDIARGKETLDKNLRKKSYDPQLVAKVGNINKAVKEFAYLNSDELYTQISRGGTVLSKVSNYLIKLYLSEIDAKKEVSKEEAIESMNKVDKRPRRIDDPGIIVKGGGVDNLMIRTARCCNPVPGDKIIGFITKGRGISVHRSDCTNILALPVEEQSRLIEVEWEDINPGKSYNVDIILITSDRKGIFSEISKACEDMDIHIAGVNAKPFGDDTLKITLTLSITSTQHMQKIQRVMRNIQGMLSVYRR